MVASDYDLDNKIELFEFIKTSSSDLLKTINKYQERQLKLSFEENELSEFLKEYSNSITQKSSKDAIDVCKCLMKTISSIMRYSSKQRLQLQVPLDRLYNEIETYLKHAAKDTQETIKKMEATRTDYRGALLWIKDISQDLDPDLNMKRLEKYRRIQAQVKFSKEKFDLNKQNTLDKIDLFTASRSNMYSNVILAYLNNLCSYSRHLNNLFSQVANSINVNQLNYEFNVVKELNQIVLNDQIDENKDKSNIIDDKSNETSNDVLVDLNEPSQFASNETEASSNDDFDFEKEWNNLFSNEESPSKQNDEIPLIDLNTSTSVPNNDDGFSVFNDLFNKNSNDLFVDNKTNNEFNEYKKTESTNNRQKWFDLFVDLDPLNNQSLLNDLGKNEDNDC